MTIKSSRRRWGRALILALLALLLAAAEANAQACAPFDLGYPPVRAAELSPTQVAPGETTTLTFCLNRCLGFSAPVPLAIQQADGTIEVVFLLAQYITGCPATPSRWTIPIPAPQSPGSYSIVLRRQGINGPTDAPLASTPLPLNVVAGTPPPIAVPAMDRFGLLALVLGICLASLVVPRRTA